MKNNYSNQFYSNDWNLIKKNGKFYYRNKTFLIKLNTKYIHSRGLLENLCLAIKIALDLGIDKQIIVRTIPKIKYDQMTQNMLACDLIPNPAITPFLKECESNHARLLDGLGMLVYQGAIAFELWTKRSPSANVMKRSLETFFKNN